MRFTIANEIKVVYLIVFGFLSRKFLGSHDLDFKRVKGFFYCMLHLHSFTLLDLQAEDRKQKVEWIKPKPMANKSYSSYSDIVYKIPVKQRTKKCNNKAMEKEKSWKGF